jgi:hypothetical protein
LDIPYGDRRKTDRTKPWCPEHGIRLHDDTFAYWNGRDRNDEARLRNFIVSHDLARAIALPKGMKAEAHRLGSEMSEDALSWNVFASLAVAGKLREATKFLTGRSLRTTPRLYLWGRRVDHPDGDHEIYGPLGRVRAELEPDLRTFVTEPDIMLVAERELVVCIEAKFGSGNPLAYDSEPKEGEKPTSRAGLLARYLGDRTSDRTRKIVCAERIGPAPRSQLLRNVVFASEMAEKTPWCVVNLAGRPDLMAGRTSLTVHEGMIGMSANAFINIKNRSHTITAEVEIPKTGANGVILAQGGRFGGWSLYVTNGKPTYTYNWLGLQRYTVAAKQALPAGKSTIHFEFAYDGDGAGKGGMGTLFVNGKNVVTGRIEHTHCCVFSLDDAADVGADEGTPVTEAYKVPFKFTGKIAKVTIELKEMKKTDLDDVVKVRKAAALKKALSD